MTGNVLGLWNSMRFRIPSFSHGLLAGLDVTQSLRLLRAATPKS